MPLGAAIFDGVIYQVAQDLFEPVGVSVDGQVGGLVDELHVLGGRAGFEVLQDLVDDGAEGDRLEVEFDAAGFQFGDGEQVLDEQLEPFGVAVDGLQELSGDLGVVLGAVEQGFDVAFDEGQGGAEFVADVGDEFLAGVLELLEAGQIVEDQDGAMPLAVAVEDGGGVDLQPALAQAGELQFVAQHLFLRVEGFDQLGQLVQAQGLHEGPAADVNGDAEEAGKGAVGELDAPALVEQQQALDHAVEEDFLLGLDLRRGPPLFVLQGFDFALGQPAARGRTCPATKGAGRPGQPGRERSEWARA